MPVRSLAIAMTLIAALAAGGAPLAASPLPAADTCRLYGFVPHSRDHRVCRANLRHYWNTGPCADSRFAAVHLRYCNIIPTFDF
jgi:hypothetical protein